MNVSKVLSAQAGPAAERGWSAAVCAAAVVGALRPSHSGGAEPAPCEGKHKAGGGGAGE